MTDYFAGYPIAGTTKNFLLTYAEGDVEAELSAMAVLGVCESDLTQLQYFFATDFQVGGRNKYSTWVHVQNWGGGGSNRGWGDTESSVIYINGTKPAPNREEYARFVFVAELAEVLMDFTGYGWRRAGSNGEALSIFLGTELHGDGYYRTGEGPRVNQWLNGNPRTDWLRSTDGTDANRDSYGCGLLFLNWLRHQLNFGIRDIVTRPNCSTLAQVHEALSGGSDGAQAFLDLVERHVPTGSNPNVERDNIFPLLEGGGRSLYLNGTTSTITANREVPGREISLDPGFICPPGKYECWLVDQTEELDVVANCRGFADAQFAWTVNGVALTAGLGPTADTIRVPAESTVWYPDGSKVVDPSKTLDLAYLITSSWNRSTLRIRNQQNLGVTDLEVGATARERAIADAGITAVEGGSLAGRVMQVEQRYYDDRKRCNPQFNEIDRLVSELSDQVFILLHTPDPYPGLALRKIVEAAERVRARVDAAAESAGLEPTRLLDGILAAAPGPAAAARPTVVGGALMAVSDVSAAAGHEEGAVGPSPWSSGATASKSGQAESPPDVRGRTET